MELRSVFIWGTALIIGIVGCTQSPSKFKVNQPAVENISPTISSGNESALDIRAVDRSNAGYIDGVISKADGSYSVVGWACAKTRPASINVHVYVGAPAGTAGATLVAQSVTNLKSEKAIAVACNVNAYGSYRFRFDIPLTNAVRSAHSGKKIFIHGINPFGVGNALIGNSGTFRIPLPLAASSPTPTPTSTPPPVASSGGAHSNVGWIDSITRNPDETYTVNGWACAKGLDPSIQVDLYFGAGYPSGRMYGRFDANQPSGDGVSTQCQTSGKNYMFHIVIDQKIANANVGSPIYIHGINPLNGQGETNTLIGNSGNIVVPLQRYFVIHPQGLNPNYYDFSNKNNDYVKDMVSKLGNPTSNPYRLGMGSEVKAYEMSTDIIQKRLQRDFEMSEAHNVPLLLHVDFEWFWDNRPDLWNWFDPSLPGYNPDNKYNVEWKGWDSPTKEYWLNWGSPWKIKPKVCYQSPRVRAEMKTKAQIIAAEINKWRAKLDSMGKSYLFLGIDPSWETTIPDQSNMDWAKEIQKNNPQAEAAVNLGYCTLSQRGFSASKPPGNFNAELGKAIAEFVEYESKLFYDLGIPKDKIFTHAPTSDMSRTPLYIAVNSYSTPGFSMYPGFFDKTQVLNTTKGKLWSITETPADVPYFKEFADLPNLKLMAAYVWHDFVDNPHNPAAMNMAKYILNYKGNGN